MTESDIPKNGKAMFAGFLMKAVPSQDVLALADWVQGVTFRESSEIDGAVSLIERFNGDGSASILLAVDSACYARVNPDLSPLDNLVQELNARRKLYQERGWTLKLMDEREVEEVLNTVK